MQIFRDPVLHLLHLIISENFGELPTIVPASPEKYFQSLCESIVSQQLSTKVADVITLRLLTLFNGDFSPATVLEMEHELLRDVGLSNAKAKYIKYIAEAWTNGLIEPEKLSALTDEEVIERLVQIKGVGRWTAEMFLIFTLGRSDVFSAGDYGLRKAVSQAYKIEMTSKPAVFLELSEQWQPHRSLASRILWKSLDKVPGK